MGGTDPVTGATVVWYFEPSGVFRPALVTEVLPKVNGGYPHLHLKIVSHVRERLTDPYGRQVVRVTDVPHENDRAVEGHYWRVAHMTPP